MEKIVIQIIHGITVHHLPAVEKDDNVYFFSRNDFSTKLDGCVIHKGLSDYDVSGLHEVWQAKKVLGKYKLCAPNDKGWNSVHFEPISLPADIKKLLYEISDDFNENNYPSHFSLATY